MTKPKHYATIVDIRREAGFLNASNLKDVVVNQQREAAEEEINLALGSAYVLPFATVPGLIKSLTIKLAAGMLLHQAYGDDHHRGKQLVEEARAKLADLQVGDVLLPTEQATSTRSDRVSSWPNDSTATTPTSQGGGERLFRIGDEY